MKHINEILNKLHEAVASNEGCDRDDFVDGLLSAIDIVSKYSDTVVCPVCKEDCIRIKVRNEYICSECYEFIKGN